MGEMGEISSEVEVVDGWVVIVMEGEGAVLRFLGGGMGDARLDWEGHVSGRRTWWYEWLRGWGGGEVSTLDSGGRDAGDVIIRAYASVEFNLELRLSGREPS